MNEKNLVKLAKFILSDVSDEQFNMKYFRSDVGDSLKKFKSKEDCGTVGCALGWAPFVEGLEVIESDFDERNHIIFELYSKRVFGYYCGDVLNFMFSGYWYEIDNTREGFVRRVVYFLEDGGYFSYTTNQYKNIDPDKIYDY